MNDNSSAADAALPDGVERRTFGGRERLSTRSKPVYGGLVDSDGWRVWDAGCSRLGAMPELDMDTGLVGGESVLYLGAALGTTVSHVTDFTGPTYAVESAPRPVRDLVGVVEDHGNLFPLLKDTRGPDFYAHVVEADIDYLVMDMATHGQTTVAVCNRQFLADDGRLLTVVKARSEDVTAEPDDVFDDVTAEFDSAYELLETARPDRFHADHLGIVARPK